MKKLKLFTKRNIVFIIAAALILALSAGGVSVYAKYVTDVEVTKGVSLEVALGYNLSKANMQSALKALGTAPTSLVFAKGSEINDSDFTLIKSGLEATGSGSIGLYQSQSDSGKYYIAPTNTNDSTSKIYAPAYSYQLFDGTVANTESLTTLDLGNLDTSLVTNMGKMFYGLKSMTGIEFGNNFKTSSVTTMEYMFDACSALESIDLSCFDTSENTSMYYMFSACPALKTLDLSSFDTSKVTNMCAAFYGCTSLTSIDFGSNFNTSKCTTMLIMFENCNSLASLDVSGFDTKNVTTMSRMFNCCYALQKLDLSSFDTSGLKDQTYMFTSCRTLAEVTLGSNFSFRDSNAYLPTPSSTYISGADGKWYVKDDASVSGMTPTQVSTYHASQSKAVTYVAVKSTEPETEETTTEGETDTTATIDKDKFWENMYFDSITGLHFVSHGDVPNEYEILEDSEIQTSESENKIVIYVDDQENPTNLYVAPEKDGISIIAPQDLSNFLRVGESYSYASQLKTVSFINFDTSNVINMSSMFEQNKVLETIIVGSGFNTENVLDSISMFADCSTALKGQNGTAWAESNPTDKTYACVDGKDGQPGYFTQG